MNIPKAIFIKLLPRVFQSSIDQMAGLRAEIFWNLVERHNALPVGGGTNIIVSPVMPMNVSIMIRLKFESEWLSRNATISRFRCLLGGEERKSRAALP